MNCCKGCVFFDRISFCHWHECECSNISTCNDYEKEEETDYISSFPDCFCEDDLL